MTTLTSKTKINLTYDEARALMDTLEDDGRRFDLARVTSICRYNAWKQPNGNFTVRWIEK